MVNSTWQPPRLSGFFVPTAVRSVSMAFSAMRLGGRDPHATYLLLAVSFADSCHYCTPMEIWSNIFASSVLPSILNQN